MVRRATWVTLIIESQIHGRYSPHPLSAERIQFCICYIRTTKQNAATMKQNKHWKEWSEIEWTNVHKLYEATQLWESDSSMDFADFKEKIQSDSTFAQLHYLKDGMDSPDYNPWS